ncbi:MAG: 50S ribosomal protein L23 [Spirochaetes bacterium]|nr:MAG: 50S ribosomal protein L23 [Spirochaetota bacterium]
MDHNDTIVKPVLSEKSTEFASQGKYVFRVAMKANKPLIRKAIKELFNVTAKKINIVNVRGKKKRVRAQYGFTSSWKKAVVTVKAGEKIELFENQ